MSAAAADLMGFDRVWLVFVFDRNTPGKWHTKVRVPVPAEQTHYSVLATRSPYRPNPIGISAVELLEVTPEGLKLGACDLLDGTAVLDVKPYIPEVDAFPDAKAGWRDRIDRKRYQMQMEDLFARQADFILRTGGLDIVNFCNIQLGTRPTESKCKRISRNADSSHWQIGCRTWQIQYSVDEAAETVTLHRILSNYPVDELAPGAEDKYQDKELHRQFLRRWPQN